MEDKIKIKGYLMSYLESGTTEWHSYKTEDYAELELIETNKGRSYIRSLDFKGIERRIYNFDEIEL